MADVILSSAVRNNLLSLQNTANLLGKTQNRLATGLKVNSALDDPTAFFTASSLNSRAGDLNRLLDDVGLAVQSLTAADDAITSITKLVENVQATARQALKAAAPVSTSQVIGNGTVADDVAATTASTGIDYSTDVDFSGLAGESVSINGNVVYTFTASATGQRAALVSALDGVANISASVDGSNNLVITSDDNTSSFTLGVSNGTVATATGLTAGTYDPTNAGIGALTGTLTIQVGSGATKTLTFGGGNIENRQQLVAALANLDGGTASVPDSSDFLTITADDGTDSITIGGSGANATFFGVVAGAHVPVVTPNAERTAAEDAFNSLLGQIDQLADDAGFNGINLLQSDNLQVLFNETGTSSLTINGVDFDSAGLGITDVTTGDFQSNTNVQASLNQLDAAVSTLRAQASTFGSNLSVVETRQDFTKNLITTLETGAAGLTLADTNEEGANLLALQTRQQLSSVALSLAAQADQNVLRLF